MTYQLDLSHLTIADIVPVVSNSVSLADWLTLADKIVIGGVWHLSAEEIKPVLSTVAPVMQEYMAQLAGVGGVPGVWKVGD